MQAIALPLVLSLLAASGAPAQRDAPRLSAEERMEFTIDYKGLRLGRAQMFLGRPDGSVIPAFLQTRTTGIASVISIRQQLTSHLDRETGLPRTVALDAVEGSYRHSDTATFDRTANKATVRERGKYDNTYVVDVPPGTVDFLALVFTLRQLPLETGRQYPFAVLAGKNVATIEAEVTGRERVQSGIGDVDAVRVRVPTSFSGEFREKNPTYIWFTDDDRRVVVRISADFAIGRATATLVSYVPGVGNTAPDAGTSASTK